MTVSFLTGMMKQWMELGTFFAPVTNHPIKSVNT